MRTPKNLRTSKRFPLGVAVVLALVSWTVAEAHIVPPEKLHPVSESYRRLGFLLTIYPVRWGEVERDTTAIANGLEAVAPEKGRDYRQAVRGLVGGAIAASGGDGPLPADLRRATAQEVHGLSTGAVLDKLETHLGLAAGLLGDRGRAALELDEARQLWAAFEPQLLAIDEAAYREHGRRWLELSSALGSPGVLGQGAVPVDRETFERESRALLSYLDNTFRAVSGENAGASSGMTNEGGTLRLASLTFGRPGLLPPPGVQILRRLPPGADINKQLPRPRQVLNMATRGVDEGETNLIALGDMAFDSSYIFGEPARSLGISCNTCHNKSITNPNFFIPGLSSRPGTVDVSNAFFAPHANNGHFDPLDIPDLRGLRFTGPYGRNGRFESLREFTRNVIVNEFGGPEPDPLLLDGLIAYMLEFDFLPNPALAPDGRLTGAAPAAARRGEELFRRPFEPMDGRSCSSCHVPSDHFLDRKRHDVGTVAGVEAHSRDRALDTPTLLGILHTPPYFHDGRAETLEEVVEHFDRQFKLGLAESEKADLVAYLETVGDGVDAYEETVHTLAAELEEFSFFLSTYELLRARGQDALIETTLQTIAFEIQAHKWDIQDDRHLPTLDRLAELMAEALEASYRGERSTVDARVAEYRALYAEHQEVLR